MSVRSCLIGLAACVCGIAPAADPPAPTTGVWLPAGAVARLGSTRLRHAAPVTCVAFAPDGKTLVSGGQDGAVRVWDVASGEQKTFTQKPDRAVPMVRFTHGGTLLAAGFSDGTIRFLDPVSLRELSVFQATESNNFDVSADGKLIATVGPSGGAVVTELGSELPKLEIPEARMVAFHPDGKLVAASGPDGTVTVYQITGGKPIFTAKHGGPLNGLTFRPDGKVFATGGTGSDGKVKFWEIGKPEPVAEIADSAGRITFLTEDRVAAVKALGYGIYDLKKKHWARTVPDANGYYAISPDGTRLAATGNDSVRVRIWDLTTGTQLHAEGDAVPDATLLAPSADGKTLFVIAADKAFHWRIGEPVPAPAAAFPGAVAAATVGGQRLAIATADGLALYDDFDPTMPLAAKPSRAVEAAGAGVKTIALSGDSKRLAFSGDDRQIRLADPATGKALRALPVQTAALSLAFLPKSDQLVILGRDGFVRLWQLGADAAGDKELWNRRVPMIRQAQRRTVAVSPDGKRIAASASARLSVLDAANGYEDFSLDRSTEEVAFQAPVPFHTVAFSPDGRRLIAGSGGLAGTIHVWDIATQSRVGRFSTGLGSVNRLAVFADGTRLASAGADDAVTVWDLKQSSLKK